MAGRQRGRGDLVPEWHAGHLEHRISARADQLVVADTGDYNGDGKSDILWRDTGRRPRDLVHERRASRLSAGLGNVATSWTIQAPTPTDALSEYEWVKEGQSCREWLIPSELPAHITKRLSRRITRCTAKAAAQASGWPI